MIAVRYSYFTRLPLLKKKKILFNNLKLENLFGFVSKIFISERQTKKKKTTNERNEHGNEIRRISSQSRGTKATEK